MPKIKPEIITKAELGRRLNVHRVAATRLVNKGLLQDAQTEDGKVNFNHPSVQAYYSERMGKDAALGGRDAAKQARSEKYSTSTKNPQAPKTKAQAKPNNSSTPTMPAFEEYENLTLGEIVERHGSITGFKIHIDALRGMADWKNKELKYLISRGNMIEISPLATNLFALVDLAFKRIVGEFPTAITPQLKAIVLSSSQDDIIQMRNLMEKELGQILKGVKSKITRDINAAKNQHRNLNLDSDD